MIKKGFHIMIQTIKGFVLKVVAAVLLMVPFAVPVVVHAADSVISNGVNCGASLNVSSIDGEGGNCDTATADAGTTLDKMIKLGINIFSVVVGVIAVVMIIIGGLKYITSGGDSGNITGAKNTILYAIIGLVVVALAQFIVFFVLNKTGEAVNG
jgi:hypothetical protein